MLMQFPPLVSHLRPTISFTFLQQQQPFFDPATMAKKSKAQLKRLMQRAEARGETYVPPDEEEKEQNSKKQDTLDRTDETDDKPADGALEPLARTNKQDGGGGKGASRKEDKAKLTAAIQLQKDLSSIEASEELRLCIGRRAFAVVRSQRRRPSSPRSN